MSYAVVWNPLATSRIDSAWLRADPEARSQLESAIVETERVLSESPLEVGESREDIHHRVFVFAPLTLFYRVDTQSNIVRVVTVGVYRGRS